MAMRRADFHHIKAKNLGEALAQESA